jgi:hypothetical protein
MLRSAMTWQRPTGQNERRTCGSQNETINPKHGATEMLRPYTARKSLAERLKASLDLGLVEIASRLAQSFRLDIRDFHAIDLLHTPHGIGTEFLCRSRSSTTALTGCESRSTTFCTTWKQGRSPEEIAAVLPLTAEQIEAAVQYIVEHYDEVMAVHQRIQERIARGNPPEIEAHARAGRARMEALRRAKARANGSELHGEVTPGRRE